MDTPIVFVPTTSAEWAKLPAYWNAAPFPAGLPSAHLGLAPIGMAAAWALVEHHAAVKIKVPRGLPDPTPHIPHANPPTVGKWRLGKALFFMPIVKVGSKSVSCAVCHDPASGFAQSPGNPTGAKFDSPSLLNAVYNRRQFWDGRADSLEETLFRGFEDEGASSPDKRLERGLEQHDWRGFVRDLVDKKDENLHRQFEAVFGIKHPTQDAVARSLATYIRTLLSGDSIHDAAEQARMDAAAPALTAAHFAAALKDDAAAASLRDSVHDKTPTRDELPSLLMKGHALFHGKARCAQCHRGPLFTDHDFHNIGFDDKEGWPTGGKETGRAVHVPVGLKEIRLVGAFRTPTLRNLIGTNPYFHDGSRKSLRDVVYYYNVGVPPFSPYVAKALKDGDQPQMLVLTREDNDALVCFMRSLQGRRVDPLLTAP
jgi:cytochrome c peroxidase